MSLINAYKAWNALQTALHVELTGCIPAGTNVIGAVQHSGVYPANAIKWTVPATSGANAIATATQAAVVGKKHYCLGYLVSLRAAAAGNDTLATLKDDTSVKFTDVIGNASPVGTRIGIASAVPLVEGTTNKDMVLTIGAAGAGAITEGVMWGYTL